MRPSWKSRGRLAQVMHMNRGAGLSAISSSIAHELNQPLGAILSNAQAAEILLRQNPPDLELIGTILADICKSDQRAGEVITHLRDLLRKNDREPEVVDLNDVIMQAVEILAPEAKARSVTLSGESRSASIVRACQSHSPSASSLELGAQRDGCHGEPPAG